MRRGLVVALVVALVAGGASAYAFLRVPDAGEPVRIEIAEGSGTRQIAELLAEEDVIRSALVFRLTTRLQGRDGELRAGAYELERGMGSRRAVAALAQGPPDRSPKVTIPEGSDVRRIASLVGSQTHISEEAFREAAESGVVRPEILPEDVDVLEGLLFPETYRVAEDASAADLIERMVGEFEARVAELDWSFAAERGLSPYEAVIIASLIEREARVPEDRREIAAVIYNRLEQGMRLQIDITAVYHLDEHKVPTRADLRRESPYNTYLIDGLPPTPIANPGMPAIEAALDPAPSDAIYYVVIDPSGKHGFTDSPEEFEELKKLRPEEVRGGNS